MFKKLNHILAAFGNIHAIKRIHVDTFTEKKISQIRGIKIAGCNAYGVWMEFNELGGYKFLELTVLSKAKIKTLKGVELSFLGGKIELFMDSDTKEINSDFSNISNRWIATISFDVNDKDIEFIRNKEYKIVQIKHKKTINFNVTKEINP